MCLIIHLCFKFALLMLSNSLKMIKIGRNTSEFSRSPVTGPVWPRGFQEV